MFEKVYWEMNMFMRNESLLCISGLLFTKVNSEQCSRLTLIWVGFLGVCFEHGVTTPCFYIWKSIEIGKSLISSTPREFEWNPKLFVTRLLPQNFKFCFWKY